MKFVDDFAAKAEAMRPSKSDINWVIMDYLVSEGYPAAAEKFAQETNLCAPSDLEGIRERVRIRTAIYSGDVAEAISIINEIDAEILEYNPLLHFHLLQLQLIEIIRGILALPKAPTANDFLPAIQFATEQLAPRAPTNPQYRQALERTMALMVYPANKIPLEFKELLDLKLREQVATEVNQAILESKGERREAKIRELVKTRVWAETQAKAAGVRLPAQPYMDLRLGDDPIDAMQNEEAMVS